MFKRTQVFRSIREAKSLKWQRIQHISSDDTAVVQRSILRESLRSAVVSLLKVAHRLYYFKRYQLGLDNTEFVGRLCRRLSCPRLAYLG